jgi:signal transduction histidine kinase/ActR/RegA family two-component response regulator
MNNAKRSFAEEFCSIGTFHLKLKIFGIGSFEGIIKNIDERKVYEHNLKIAKEKAEESDRLKTAFLSNMSHEIRTPMNAIIGFSELLSRAGLSETEKGEYIRQINFGADTLMRLIDDIIDISKIEAGQLKMNPSFFPLKPLFDELKLLFGRTLKQQKKNHIELIEETPEITAGIQLHADEFRLRQVFSNLLSNAIKFTEEGKISFGIKSIKDGEIVFFVKDTGVGVSRAKQEFIFERFRQGHETKESFYGGTGLGLAISKNIVQLMGGELKVTSEERKGSEFYFSIPHEGNVVEIPEEKVSLDRSPRDWSNITFLIAEDDHSNFILLQESLRHFKVNIIRAENGKQAVEHISENKEIDLILMDVQMPEMNGYEAAKLIKEIRPDVPIIAQTAYAMEGERQASIKAGCDDYISKPIIMKELIFILNKYLDGKVTEN